MSKVAERNQVGELKKFSNVTKIESSLHFSLRMPFDIIFYHRCAAQAVYYRVQEGCSACTTYPKDFDSWEELGEGKKLLVKAWFLDSFR